MKRLRPTIIRLLSNMGSTREIRLYLERFSELDAARFAVVKVDGAVLGHELSELVSSLAFLQQVGLTPIVVHGAGPGLDAEMAAAGVEKRVVDGLRYTPEPALAIVRRALQRENLRLVEALQAEGVRATSINTGVFECELLGRRKYGLVGKVVRVDTAGIEAAVAVSSIPVVSSLGETAGGQILNLSADHATHALVVRIEPYKIILLNEAGGLLDEHGDVIDSINLSTEYTELLGRERLPGSTRAEIRRIHDLLMRLPPASSLSVTRPDEVAEELFTHRGSGTLVRRGERIRRYASWKRLDLERLRALIESSFGRTLAPDYFQVTKPFRVYCTEHYRAAIVLTREDGLTYMDKFVVDEEAQGEGLGRAIWQVMHPENPQLFWRSRPHNPVNDFYFANSDGAVRDPRWTIFWYGIEDWNAVRRAIRYARQRPPTVRRAGVPAHRARCFPRRRVSAALLLLPPARSHHARQAGAQQDHGRRLRSRAVTGQFVRHVAAESDVVEHDLVRYPRERHRLRRARERHAGRHERAEAGVVAGARAARRRNQVQRSQQRAGPVQTAPDTEAASRVDRRVEERESVLEAQRPVHERLAAAQEEQPAQLRVRVPQPSARRVRTRHSDRVQADRLRVGRELDPVVRARRPIAAGAAIVEVLDEGVARGVRRVDPLEIQDLGVQR
jgi:acetylglutamate kinase